MFDIGVQGTSLIWIQNYLMKRRIRTSIGQTLSDELTLDYGVPQGSILGPLLFLVFINDLTRSFTKCNLHFYVHDTVIYYSHKDVDVIQSVLNEALGNLQSWMNANRCELQ